MREGYRLKGAVKTSGWRPIGIKCPVCNGEIVEKAGNQKCENECRLNGEQLRSVLNQQGAIGYTKCPKEAMK